MQLEASFHERIICNQNVDVGKRDFALLLLSAYFACILIKSLLIQAKTTESEKGKITTGETRQIRAVGSLGGFRTRSGAFAHLSLKARFDARDEVP